MQLYSAFGTHISPYSVLTHVQLVLLVIHTSVPYVHVASGGACSLGARRDYADPCYIHDPRVHVCSRKSPTVVGAIQF